MCSNCNNYSKFKELESYIDKQPNKDSSLIAILHKAQELYGVITFYSYFTIKPKGKYVISVCTGTACFVRGSGEILELFKKKLHINVGETTSDGLYTLDMIRCVGACGLAPVVSINSKIYGKFDSSKIDIILNECKERCL